MNNLIYLDYNGTTPIDEKVIKVINQELKDSWGNPSSGSDLKSVCRNRTFTNWWNGVKPKGFYRFKMACLTLRR